MSARGPRSGRRGAAAIKRRATATVEAELLKRVRARGHISRVELARELDIVPSTAGIYVDRLIEQGFLVEVEAGARGMGRPPKMLALNPEGGSFVGVDFEARQVMATRVDFSQRPIREVRRAVSPADGAERILRAIESVIAEVMGRGCRDVLGIGIGLPGAIDPVRGLALGYEKVRGWRDLAIGPRLSRRFGLPVFLENNIRSMALAEMWFGMGRGIGDFVCLGTRSGIAAGIVVGGQLVRGHDHRAGEVGHWWCASRGGRLEDLASLSAIVGELRPARGGSGTPVDRFLRDVAGGDRGAGRLLDRVAELHGWAVQHLIELLNPRRVILAGPLTALGERFLGPVRAEVLRLSPPGAAPDIVQSTLGEYSAALGAAALALHQWTPEVTCRR